MRIVAGSHRGRRLRAPAGRDVRPTADRTRAAVFDTLTHGIEGGEPEGRTVLDAFAGTGALGIEALSRGAAHAVFLERDRRVRGVLEANLRDLGLTDRATVIGGDALRPPRAPRPCGLVFLDPPYRQGLVPPALTALAAAGWLAPAAVIVAETAANEPEPATEGFEALDVRRYGAARISYLRAAL